MRRWLAALSTVAVSAVLVVGAGVAPAAAAGPAVLSLETTPVNAATGTPITTAGYGQNSNRVAYRIAYSCSEATCTDTVVTLPATQLDPTYGEFRLLSYETWTPPAGGGATISGDAATGLTVNLGDVPAGTSSTFLVVYSYPVESGYTTAAASAYYPPGFQIEQQATIASLNATPEDVTAAAAPVTWEIPIPDPTIVKVGPTSVRPDIDVEYTIRMGSGCFVYGGSGRIVGDGSQLCAESFTVVDELPAQAVFVSASDGGTYDSDTHTVTWLGSGPNAAGGWGSSAGSGWVGRGEYHPRTVTVQYPAQAFPEGDGGADFMVPVTNDASVSMTYLDDAETVKTAAAEVTHDVVRVTPFGRATQVKDTTADYTDGTGRRHVDVPPVVDGLVCPPSGIDDWGRACTPGAGLAPFTSDTSNWWSVDTYNRGNVPGVATVIDEDLGDSSARVYRIATNPAAASITYTITDGVTTTSDTVASGAYAAPAGSWITAATITSGTLNPTNLLPEDTGGTRFRVAFHYELIPGSALGDWDNSASATMSYPDNPEVADISVTSGRILTLRELPAVSVPARFGADAVSATVEGGGQAVPGSPVTFAVSGATVNVPADQAVSPQYVFIAPEGWEIQPGTASFAEGAVPPGAAFVYRDVEIGGVTRQAVVASWPTGTTFGSNATLPTMSVVATPTFAVTAGTASVANVWIGDFLNQYPADGPVWNGRVIDTTDVDADGDTVEAFASDSISVTVSGSDRLDVIKEICVETADGDCIWVSNPDIVVGVAPAASDITYRVTLRNGGNTTLTDVIGYDVLPFDGDPRGSTFGETLNEVVDQSSNVTLAYSSSTNPCRDEVLPDASNPGCATGWDAALSGASAIQMVVDGALAPGAEASFTFAADVVPGADADAIACNSVAVDTASTVPAEPRAVCATTQEADLEIAVPERLPLQAGRPGVVPFTVTNLGGSQNAPASVEIEVPEGIRITSLTPAGWACQAAETAPDGSVLGPVTLTCDAVNETGVQRSLALGEPDALNLPAVIPDAALVGENTCFPAVVSGLMSDPNLDNNDDAACFAVMAGDALIDLVKDDGLDEVRIGDEITYSLEVSNLLVGETLTSVVVTDELPENVVFVSASNGGEVDDQGTPDGDGNAPGGTVTWTLDELSPSGTPSEDGSDSGGAAGAVQTVTVTVRVLQAAESSETIVNEATVEAVDPLNPDEPLTAADDDTDALLRTAAVELAKSVTPTTVSAVGQTLSYEFLVTNSGDVTLTDLVVTETVFTGTGEPVEVVCPDIASLAPTAAVTCTATYEVTQADLDAGSISNTATVTGTPPTGLDDPTSVPSTALVETAFETALTLVKTASPQTAEAAGEEISYEFVVTNDSNVTVSGIQVLEGAFTGDPEQLSDVVCPPAAPVAPGDTVTCTATYSLTQADVDAGSVSNSATATADAAGTADDPVAPESTALVSIPAAPALAVEKSVADPASIDSAGDTVTYLFEVTNTGNVTLSEIAVVERSFTGLGDPVEIVCPEEPLAPAGEMTCAGTYELVQEDVDAGGLDNTAAVTGLAPGGGLVESADSTARLDITPAPALTLVKSATPGDLIFDQDVTYSFVVTNSGNVTITGVAIDELEFTGSGDLSLVVCEPGADSLAPGQQVLCEAAYTITQVDVDAGVVDNTATATGTSPAGAVTSDPSSIQLPFDQTPGVELVKSADVEGYTEAGEAIEYRFQVTNTGNVTLTELMILEQDFSGTGTLSDIECTTSALLPGQVADCTAAYEVTQADVDAGELTNVATAEGLAAGAAAPTASGPSSVTVPFSGSTGLVLEKTGEGVDTNDDGAVSAGDTIEWSFAVTNTGAATLTALEIVDPQVSAISCEADVLAPGASVTCIAADYQVTAADATAGRVVNTATATALGAGAVAVTSAEVTATVEVAAASPLPTTGAQLSVGLVVLAVMALILGAAALWFARSRRTTRP